MDVKLLYRDANVSVREISLNKNEHIDITISESICPEFAFSFDMSMQVIDLDTNKTHTYPPKTCIRYKKSHVHFKAVNAGTYYCVSPRKGKRFETRPFRKLDPRTISIKKDEVIKTTSHTFILDALKLLSDTQVLSPGKSAVARESGEAILITDCT